MKTYDANPAEHGAYYRAIDIDVRGLDEDARTVPATLSSTAKVPRFFGFEQLSHSAKSVDLGRAKRGLPLLFSHDQEQPIGRVERIMRTDDQVTGVLRFSNNKRAQEVWEDVRDGFLSDVSIGYRVNKWSEVEGGRVAEKWELLEASVVAVPADPSASINREDPAMSEQTSTVPETGEAERLKGIANAFRSFPEHSALMYECIEKPDMSVDAARQLLLNRLADKTEAIDGTAPAATAGADASDKLVRGLKEAMAVKFDIRPKPENGERQYNADQAIDAARWSEEYKEARANIHANPFGGMSLVEMAREFLVTVHNQPDARRWRPSKVVDETFSRAAGIIGHGRDDFTNLLADNTGKMLQVGYTEAPETFNQWCRIGQLNDFKTADRPNMSTFGDLDDVTNDHEYEYGSFSDRKETISLKTWGKLFSITRTALINDDQNAFAEIPRAMGRAAARMVGDEVYSILTTNAAMNEDAVALFHTATHNNLIASGTAPTVAALNAMYTDMATQTDPASNVLNIRPAYIIVPPDLWGTTRTLMVSTQTPGGAHNDVNVWQNMLEQVTEPRLNATSAVQWYLAASPSSVGTIEVGYLDGVQAPFLAQEEGFTRDGITYKVRLDVGTAALDWRGLAKNNGT